MQYNVAQLMKEHTGAARHYEIDEDISPLAADDMTVEAPLTGVVTLMRDTDGILVTGDLKTKVGMPCVRCLEPVVLPVDIELEEQFFPTIDVETGHKLSAPADAEKDTLIDAHHILDLTELIRQSLLLAVPLQPVHPQGCAIEAPPVGDDDAGAATDPRWAALAALREQQANSARGSAS
ncbi:MAG: DUF177 domain-containing protein [Anaerolineae bacterium]